jgi:DNA-binding transcriptional regulator YhcF (GntR family)
MKQRDIKPTAPQMPEDTLIDLAWKVGATYTQKLILVALVYHANKQGECLQSVGVISKMTGACERTIRRAISDLENLGHITRNLQDGMETRYSIHPRTNFSLDNKKTKPKQKKKISNDLRKAVFERDLYRCRHCGTHTELTVDHIIPESKGGKHSLDNMQTLCHRCNCIKGTNGGEA